MIQAEVLWLVVRRSSVEGRTCREYDVTDEAGNVLMSARAFTWSRTIAVHDPAGSFSFEIERSRWFPLTGRATVRTIPSKVALGTVSRNGVFRSADGVTLGRFIDARSARKRMRESLIQGTLDALVTGEGSSSVSGPDAFVLEMGGAVRGTMQYQVVPFGRSAEAESATRSRLGAIVQVVRDRWRSMNEPHGWKLTRSDGGVSGADPRLDLAAAIFAAELSRW